MLVLSALVSFESAHVAIRRFCTLILPGGGAGDRTA
jgi:hypothetical protein